MGPEEVNALVLPHTAEISRTTVALFKYVSGDGDHFGSGVLLRIEQNRFLVTAAHVADQRFDQRWRPIFFGTPTGDDLIQLAWLKGRLSPKEADPNREDDPIDMAVLELRPEVADKLAEFMRFVTLNELEVNPKKLQDGWYLVNGYSDFRAEKDEMEQIVDAQNLPYFTRLHDLERSPIPNVSRTDHVVLEVNRTDEAGGEWDRLDLDRTHGISGGGMWRVLDEGEPIQSLNWRQGRLVAIITDRSDPEVMGPVQYLRGTRMRHAIGLIYQGWPELRSAIVTAFPRGLNG